MALVHCSPLPKQCAGGLQRLRGAATPCAVSAASRSARSRKPGAKSTRVARSVFVDIVGSSGRRGPLASGVSEDSAETEGVQAAGGVQ